MQRVIKQLSHAASGSAEGSALQVLAMALSRIEARVCGGQATLHAQLQRLNACLSAVEPLVAADVQLTLHIGAL